MSDVFRKEDNILLPSVRDEIYIIKSKAENLLKELISIEEDTINFTVDKRCMALAKTNLEQAVMWAVKAIT